ncbi:hypothetical protein ACX40Y_06120 [Sphingomonas sp. RS6]
MKHKLVMAAAAVGLVALAGCNNTPREQAAENIEATTDNIADNYEAMADNATTDAAEDALDNRAEAVRDRGDAMAEDVRTNDADTNLKNGM